MAGVDNTSGLLVYQKGKHAEEEENDIWDDKELIKAYNKAVGLAYTASGSRKDGFSSHIKIEKKPKHKNRNPLLKWKAGDACMAPYSEDGELYEAKIIQILKGGKVTVEYSGYDEKATVYLADLQVVGEKGERGEEEDEGEYEEGEANQSSDMGSEIYSSSVGGDETREAPKPSFNVNPSFMHQIPTIPPPPPPHWLGGRSCPSDQEAMSSMLMSWYMSGYHTGYYQAMREMRKGGSWRRGPNRRRDFPS